jgi:hypothetical protein|tara:strand:- start:640 stop:828 length:189 start_codon:yes stop_codon:yes gene_type:complete
LIAGSFEIAALAFETRTRSVVTPPENDVVLAVIALDQEQGPVSVLQTSKVAPFRLLASSMYA